MKRVGLRQASRVDSDFVENATPRVRERVAGLRADGEWVSVDSQPVRALHELETKAAEIERRRQRKSDKAWMCAYVPDSAIVAPRPPFVWNLIAVRHTST